MPKTIGTWWMVVAVVATACGGREASSQDGVVGERQNVANAEQHAQRAVEAILAGERETWGPAACEVLESGIVSEVFGVEAAAVSYRPGSKIIPHPMCTAIWEAPNKAELEAACQEEIAAQSKRRMEARLARESFDEKLPDCFSSNHATEVGLTVMNQRFDSAAAAVASLEATVAQLEDGITIAGRTKQVDFDDWMDGVGDKAAWAPRMSELSVAADGVRFAVAVRGLGDRAANREKAIALAQRVVELRWAF